MSREPSSYTNDDSLQHEAGRLTFEPPYDKANKMTRAHSEDSDQPEHPSSLIRVRLPHPTPLEGEVRYVQAQDQKVVTTRSPGIITEFLLTRSMLIKMYVHAIYT